MRYKRLILLITNYRQAVEQKRTRFDSTFEWCKCVLCKSTKGIFHVISVVMLSTLIANWSLCVAIGWLLLLDALSSLFAIEFGLSLQRLSIPIVIYDLSGFIRHHFPFANRFSSFFLTVISFTISILLAFSIVASFFSLARARLIINQHKTVPQNDFNFVYNWYVWPGSIVIGGRFKMVESIGERTFFLLSGMKHRYS